MSNAESGYCLPFSMTRVHLPEPLCGSPRPLLTAVSSWNTWLDTAQIWSDFQNGQWTDSHQGRGLSKKHVDWCDEPLKLPVTAACLVSLAPQGSQHSNLGRETSSILRRYGWGWSFQETTKSIMRKTTSQQERMKEKSLHQSKYGRKKKRQFTKGRKCSKIIDNPLFMNLTNVIRYSHRNQTKCSN